MTIASEIQRIKTNIANAYTSCNSKGATMPATQNSDNLATTINSISGGGSTLITKTITQNGTYNASSDNADGYSSVTVNVPTFIGINREVVNGVYKAPTTSFNWSLPSTATDLENYALYYAFYKSNGLTNADLSSLTAINGTQALYYAFYYCTSLVSVDLSGITTIDKDVMRYAFANSSVATVDMSGVTTIDYDSALSYICQSCTNLTELDLSNVKTITGNSVLFYACNGCTNLESIDFSELETITGFQTFRYAFQGCTKLVSVNFSSLKTIGANTSSTNYGHFSSCFNGCKLLTSITFPNLEKLYCTGGTTTSYGTFANNNKVEKIYFPKLDTITYGSGASTSNQNACKNIFYGCSALTELHFAVANQSAIEASPGYSTAWGRGAGNVTIYFDL